MPTQGRHYAYKGDTSDKHNPDSIFAKIGNSNKNICLSNV